MKMDDKFNKNNYIECVHRVYKNKDKFKEVKVVYIHKIYDSY